MKMKKTLLAVAVAAGLGSTTAQAVNVATNGVGEVLLYPYYSVMNGNQTFITVTNTSDDAKALKVRFREGVSSRDVFDFTLYLSPQDVWSGVISRTGDTIRMITNDNSCTVPVVKGNPAATFSTQRIRDIYTATSKANRISEGHIEILEMASLGTDDTLGFMYDAVKHDETRVPEDCAAVNNWTSAVSLNAFGAGNSFAVGGSVGGSDELTASGETQTFGRPTGGLYGHAAVYNPNDGTYFTYQADALNGWAEGPVWFPQNESNYPGLASYTTDTGLAESPSGEVTYFDLPDLSTPSLSAPLDLGFYPVTRVVNGTTQFIGNNFFTGALGNSPTIGAGTASQAKRNATTSALMKSALANDYITSAGFETEWVVTFPTRYLHVPAYGAGGILAVAAPFTVPEVAATGEACHTIANFEVSYYDREEQQNTTPGSIGFSPGGTSPTAFQLCYEVNVMAFNQTNGGSSSVLQSNSIAKYISLADGFENGWAFLNLSAYNLAGWDGLPVTGFMAVSDTSGAVPRGATYRHHLQD